MNPPANARKRLLDPARFQAILAAIEQAPECPFRGISAYRLLDNMVLFSRDDEIERLRLLITVYRGAMVFGGSGVGKTSMLNAGLVPEAMRLGYLPERIRVRRDEVTPFVVERFSTGPGPNDVLPSNLVPGSDSGSKVAISLDQFLERLRALKPEAGALLIFDQFEEIVTLFEDAPNREEIAGARKLQERLFDVLEQGLADPTLSVKLVFSFREDYLGRLSPLLYRCPDLRERFVRVPPLQLEDLPQVIHGPVEKFEALYAERFPQPLRDDILRQFQQHVGSGVVNLSEVQIVCRWLWDNPAETALFKEKGIGEVVDRYFNDTFSQAPEAERGVIQALLSGLVTSLGTRNWVSEDGIVERLVEETGLPRARITDLCRELDRDPRRLLLSEERQNVVYYTILSEFLVPRIRRWQEERRVAREQKRLADLAQTEKERAEKQAAIKRAKSQVKTIIGLGLFLVMAVALGSVVALLKNRELRQRDLIRYQLTLDSLQISSTSTLFTDSIASLRVDSLSDSLSRFSTTNLDSVRGPVDLQSQLFATRRVLDSVLRRIGKLTSLSDSSRRASSAAINALNQEVSLLRLRLNGVPRAVQELNNVEKMLMYLTSSQDTLASPDKRLMSLTNEALQGISNVIHLLSRSDTSRARAD